MPDAPVDPVVHVGAADARPFWLYEDVVGGLEAGDGAVFVGKRVGGFENERGVLFLEKLLVLVQILEYLWRLRVKLW